MKRVSFNLDKNKIYLFHNYYPSNKYTTQNIYIHSITNFIYKKGYIFIILLLYLFILLFIMKHLLKP